ncbi:Werner Syndrome-like exonuclease [Abrus precatorius]|uniref:Werner Syndrome-like exonuclease n=1 Tax=Abrus precatorius TaxID=3816 RepID=A0A8B8L539_ABRPR|nr:Werner Syndrome-like exonuclease [Abrus precatorius]
MNNRRQPPRFNRNGTSSTVMPNHNPIPRPTISIVDHYLPNDSHNLYDVTFYSDTIHTLLTSEPSLVDSWISDILRIHRRRLRHLIVGLDVEWRPNTQRNMQNPVATLQLCVGRRCLVFQILFAQFMPESLISFLGDRNLTFVGVGIEEDVEKLLEDYSLLVANFVDLRSLAAEKLGEQELNRAGVKTLGLRVLGREVHKPQWITRSRWDNRWLTAEQVQYAALDAFVSFEVGRRLSSLNNDNIANASPLPS